MTLETENKTLASVELKTGSDSKAVLSIAGRLDPQGTSAIWRKTMRTVRTANCDHIIVDAENVDYCDGCGLGLLLEISLLGEEKGFEVEIRGLNPDFQKLLDMFSATKFVKHKPAVKHRKIAEEIGHAAVNSWQDIRSQIAFIGELCAASINAIRHPMQIRWKDMMLAIEQAGANGVGIIVLIGFLFGLIMAFSSAMPLRQFGAEIYVSDLAAIALVRVLGPFMTAIILAGRTGSSFAAELGTMKINDEIDALTTMGLDPVRFLVIPRVFATTIIAPLLAILAILAGLVGTAAVILSLGYSLVTFAGHVYMSIDAGDLIGGLFKALVYGWLIGSIGCLRGLETETGASAVGISTTRSVVSSIIMVVLAEGIFAVIYYCLGI
jgi:phospholipid/cholesterol/gamma-HCH transport system permease protein